VDLVRSRRLIGRQVRSTLDADEEERENMGNRLYVGNLSYDVTTETLRECFTECGEVSETHLVTDRETGRPRGFAFVTMSNEAEAAHAISRLNNAMFEGRPLRVSVAEERSAGAPNRNARGGHRGW
jgi:RNA recognition motif-containing protein